MPTGDFLYADKLAKTLHKKAADKYLSFPACPVCQPQSAIAVHAS
jgi:hypothetical protein